MLTVESEVRTFALPPARACDIHLAQPRRLCAGAPTPEVLTREVCDRLRELGAGAVRTLAGVRENVVLRLPAELLRRSAAR
jgi:hypothetical protein